MLVLVHTKGWQRPFHAVTNARILALSSATEATSARCKAWRSTIPNHTPTRFNHEAEVGIEVHPESTVLDQPRLGLGGIVHGVVVHYEVQLPLGGRPGPPISGRPGTPGAGAAVCRRR